MRRVLQNRRNLWVFFAEKYYLHVSHFVLVLNGGEIVPSLFIGATFGSALAPVFGMPVDICAACGMVGVFCAVTNSPISSLLIAFELFGFAGMPYFLYRDCGQLFAVRISEPL